MKKYFLYCIVFLFVTLQLIYKLAQVPSGLEQSEAAFGYNAYSLLATGMDEYGKHLPLILTSFGDYKLASFSYWLIPFIRIFGLTEFAVRFGSVIAGIVTLLILFKGISYTLQNRKVALITALFISITPWFIVLCRFANESILAALFYFTSLYSASHWFKKNNRKYLVISVIFLTFSVLTYYSAWYPVLLVCGILVYIARKKSNSRLAFASEIFLISIPILLICFVSYISAGQRLKQINVIDHRNAQGLLSEQTREDHARYPIFLTRYFHNKITFYPHIVLANISDTLNFNFFFLNGDKSDRRFAVPYNGVLYLWSLVPIIWGAYAFIKRRSITFNLLIFLFALFPFIGSAFSVYGSESQRALIALPVIAYVCASGILDMYHFSENRKLFQIFISILGLLAAFQFQEFNHQYFWHSTVHTPWYNNYGMKSMVSSVDALKKSYKKIVVSGNTAIFFYFYDKADPIKVQAEATMVKSDALGYIQRLKYGNIEFMDTECPKAGKEGILFVCQGNNIPRSAQIIKTEYFLDNEKHFTFIELKKTNDTLELWDNGIAGKPLVTVLDDKSPYDWIKQ